MKNVIIALVVAIFGATSMIYANETAPGAATETTAAPAAEAHPAVMHKEHEHKRKDHKKEKKAKKAAAEEAQKLDEAAQVAH